MKIYYAPEPLPNDTEYKFAVFLAGSIEMGTAEDWQSKVIKMLEDIDCVIFNPRRPDWDSTWVQSIDNPKFKEQVMWELNALEEADIILMYLAPQTKSPISLLELGLHVDKGKLIVVCPEGFWRKGNVDIVCEKYHASQYPTIEEAVKSIRIDTTSAYFKR